MRKTSSDIWHDVEYKRDQESKGGINWWVSEDEVQMIKRKLYDLLMPDLSGKTQEAIEKAFSSFSVKPTETKP